MNLELQTGYIADAIIDVKLKKFGENFTSMDEVLIMQELIEQRLKNKGLRVKFIEAFFSNYFKVANGVITKYEESKILKEYISNEEIRKIIYDEEFIYFCLIQMIINKLYSSVEHRCDDCRRECSGDPKIPRHEENGCCNFKWDFKQQCIWNLSIKERDLIEKKQIQQKSVKMLKKDMGKRTKNQNRKNN